MTSSELAGLAQRLQSAMNAAFAVDESDIKQSAGKLDDSNDCAAIECEDAVSADTESPSDAPADRDHRLYLPLSDDWQVRVHKGIRAYCSYQNPGESWFHLLVDGELYLQSGDEKICLNCALRRGLLTTDRLYWQKGLSKTSSNKTSGDKAG